MKKITYLFTLILCLWAMAIHAQAPTITSFSPASGAVGTLVTITGTNLSTPTAFTIGGVAAIVVSNTPTSLVGMVMPNATTGAISLRTAAGTANSTTNFTVMPTRIIPAQQGSKLIGTGAVGNAQQGNAVAISADGNTIAMAGVQDNNNIGAIWVFVRNNGIWVQQGNKLVPSNFIGTPQIGAERAIDISADGNTIIVGAWNDAVNVGAAWVFIRNNGTWTQQAKLIGTGGSPNSLSGQGSSVAISADGNTALVSSSTDRENNVNAGAFWIFVRNNGIWTQQGEKLRGTGYIRNSVFNVLQGSSICISSDGNTVAIGGHEDNEGVGAVWIFIRNNGIWTQQGNKLVGEGSIGRSFQGLSTAISADGNTVAVGAQADNNNKGAAWIFVRNKDVWTQEDTKLITTDISQGIGHRVSLSADGNLLCTGGFGYNQVFIRNNGKWLQQGSSFIAKNLSADLQINKISSDGTTIVTGVPNENSKQGGIIIFTNILSSKAIPATNPSPTGFSANWNRVEGAVSYQIDIAIDAGFTNMLSSYRNLSIAGTSLVINGLAGGITYYYRVRAVSANGIASENSNVTAIAIPQANGISVLSPRAGDYLRYRSFFTVALNSNLSGSTKVELLGLDKPLLIAELPQGVRAFRWFVPSSLPAKGGYKIVASSLGSVPLKSESQEFSIGIEPPEIRITPDFPTSIAYQSPTALQISVDAGSLLRASEVVFYYKTFSSSEYKTVKVNALASNPARFAATIPYSEFDNLGVEYFFEFSKDGFVQANSILGKTTIKYPNLEIPYKNYGKNIENYEILAIPLNLKDNLVVDIFKDELGEADIKQWRTFRYSNGSTAPTEGGEVKAGEGFWFIAKDNPNKPLMTGEGTTISTSTEPAVMYAIPVRKGWNQIGNPYLFALDFENMKKANAKLGITSLITFEKGEYVPSAQLKPFQGGFVFVGSDGSLRFPPAPFDSNSGGRTEENDFTKSSLNRDTWQVKLNLLSSTTKPVRSSRPDRFEKTNDFGGFGMHPSASTSKDEFDQMTPPRFFEHLEINFLHKEYFYPYFSEDIVPTQENYVWEFSVESNAQGNYKTLSWDNSAFGSEKGLVLFDIEKNIKIDMSKENAYTFELNDGKKNFKVYFGDESFLKKAILPEVATVVAYPNPFVDEIKFNISLPEKSKVYLQIFNSLGQNVHDEEREFEVGFNVWSPLSVSSRTPHTNGVYFYQIQISSEKGTQTLSGKLVRE